MAFPSERISASVETSMELEMRLLVIEDDFHAWHDFWYQTDFVGVMVGSSAV